MTAFTQTGTMINPVILRHEAKAQRDAQAMRSDVALVLFWAALVPGLMWLGSIVGF